MRSTVRHLVVLPLALAAGLTRQAFTGDLVRFGMLNFDQSDSRTPFASIDGRLTPSWAFASGNGPFTAGVTSGGGVVVEGANLWFTELWPSGFDVNTLTPPVGLTGVKQVATGITHIAALKTNGTVVAWGYGDGAKVPAGLTGVTQIDAGSSVTVARKSDGRVVKWPLDAGEGSVWSGFSGIAQVVCAPSSGQIIMVRSNGSAYLWLSPGGNGAGGEGFDQWEPVIQAAASDKGNLFLRSDGRVFALGSGGGTGIPVGLVAKSIAMGDEFGLALKADGTVVRWGNISCPGGCQPWTMPGLSGIKQVSSGLSGIALGTDGRRTVTFEQQIPAATTYSGSWGFPQALATTVQVAGSHSGDVYYLRSDGTVTLWNPGGATSNVTALSGATQIAVSRQAAVARRADGTLRGIDIGSFDGEDYKAHLVPSGNTYTQVAVGEMHGVARRADGTVKAWGGNAHGQAIAPAGLTAVTQVTAGMYHSVARRSNGTIVCWGAGGSTPGEFDFGQCRPPAGLTGVAEVVASPEANVNLARKSDGTVVAWGQDRGGVVSLKPSLAAVARVAITLADGDGGPLPCALALHQDGTITAWGTQKSRLNLPSRLPDVTHLAGAGGEFFAVVTARDCNSNGMRDSLEASRGWVADANLNLVPDSCESFPSGVTATDGTRTVDVGITWAAAAGATGYKVFRATKGALPVQVGTTTAAIRSFADTTAVAGVPYQYSVRTVTAAGESAASKPDAGWRNVTVPTAIVASDGSSTAHVAVTWTGSSGATGYKVFRAIDSAVPAQVGTTTASALAFNDATAAVGVRYKYSVRATTEAGDSALSAANFGWRNVAAPSGVSASDGTFTAHVRVSWTASTSAAVTGYRVQRKLPDGAWTVAAEVTGRATSSFNDSTIAPGVVASYSVRAVTAAGPSASSATNTGFRGAAGGMPSLPASPPSAPGGGSSAPMAAAAAQPPTTGAAKSTSSAGTAAAPAAGWTGGSGDGHAADSSAGDCEAMLARLRSMIDAASAVADHRRADGLAGLLGPRASGPATSTESSQAAESAACRMFNGDVNLDGRHDGADLAEFLDAWRSGDIDGCDLDRDGDADREDLERVLVPLSPA